MMNILKTVKCICILIKCSKYLYFMKKALCLMVLLLSGAFVLGVLTKSNTLMPCLKVKK